MIHLEYSLKEFRSEWFGQGNHLKISFGAHQASYFGIRNSDKLPTIKYYSRHFMWIISSMILIYTKYSLIPGYWYELLTRMSRSEWFMQGAHFKILFWVLHVNYWLEIPVLSDSCKVIAHPGRLMWVTGLKTSLWIFHTGHLLEDLMLYASHKLPARKDFPERFGQSAD